MSTFYSIPLAGIPEKFKITLGGVDYHLTFTYQNTQDGGWYLNIADSLNNPIVNGIPLVTGVNLLAKYPHLGFAGRLWVQTDHAPDSVPTFKNLGTEANLYWVTD